MNIDYLDAEEKDILNAFEADAFDSVLTPQRKEMFTQAAEATLQIQLLIDIQDGALILTPPLEDYVEYLTGLHSEVWSDVDTTEYIERERNAWTQSNND